MRTLRIYSINFPMYHTVMLTIVIILYFTSLVSILSYGWKRVPFYHLSQILPPPVPNTTSGNHKSDPFFSMRFLFFFLIRLHVKWGHTVFVFLWYISLKIMPSRFICVFRNVWIFSFLWLNNIPLYIYISTSRSRYRHTSQLYPFIYWGCLGCFHVFAIVNNFTMSMVIQIFF